MNTTSQILFHLSLIPGIGAATIKHLLAMLTVEQLTNLPKYFTQFLAEQAQLPIATAQKIVTGLADTTALNRELELADMHSISVVTLLDVDYPTDLKHIHLPPPVLYVAGTLKPEVPRLGIVGSRKADTYAQRVIKKIVPPLVEAGWEIVSGGAIGADTMAHEATVDASGTTHVVFGSGLLHPYPHRNINLFKRVVTSGGALISCFPLKTPPDRGLFPARNRIIAGMSQGLLVVQAAERSGALITAHHALDEGRQVFAVPGSIDHELSVGPNRLIQSGAKLVTGAGDILEEYGQVAVRPAVKEVVLEGSAGVVMKTLSRPMSLDEIVVETGLGFEEIQGVLFELQLEGQVRCDHAGRWT